MRPVRSVFSVFAPALVAVTLLAGASAASPAPAMAQVAPADSASVLLDAARAFEAEDRWDVAEALYRLIVRRYGQTSAAADARTRLADPPTEVVYGDGTTELTVWMTMYGAFLGVAVPASLGADDPEPYGAGLLIGGPAGFAAGRSLARSLRLTEGQARAITLGGSWGTWQGFGWREVFDIGVQQHCETFEGRTNCWGLEDSFEESFAGMIVGGLAGITAGALLSGRDITPGVGTAVNFGSLWGTWFGIAGAVLTDMEDDDALAATLMGGNAGLLATALLAPGWNVTRSRARMVSILGVLGGIAGAGVDLIVQPDDAKVGIAIPLVGSIIGLVVGAHATRAPEPETLGSLDDPTQGALIGFTDGRLAFGAPVPVPTFVPMDGPRGTQWKPALSLDLFRARF